MENQTTISLDASHVTFINVFTVVPERQRELLDVVMTASREVMSGLPGFISGNFRASTDGTRIVNYVQWDTLEQLEAAQTDTAAREHMERAINIASRIEPHVYTVEAVHHR